MMLLSALSISVRRRDLGDLEKEKQTRRMVAQATGSAASLVSAPCAPSRHWHNGHIDASVARRGALPWPERSMGSGQHAIAVTRQLVAAATFTAQLVKTQNRGTGNCIANSIGISYYSAVLLCSQ